MVIDDGGSEAGGSGDEVEGEGDAPKAVVVRVAPGSLAASSGVRGGDFLVGLDGAPLRVGGAWLAIKRALLRGLKQGLKQGLEQGLEQGDAKPLELRLHLWKSSNSLGLTAPSLASSITPSTAFTASTVNYAASGEEEEEGDNSRGGSAFFALEEPPGADSEAEAMGEAKPTEQDA